MIHIRDRPSLRLHEIAIAPNGHAYRWGGDEPNPAQVPSGIRFSTTMPGGFETHDVVLPRRPGLDYGDLRELSTIQAVGAGGRVATECRLERAPQVSGDKMSVSPSAVGWQANLEDNKFVRALYVDSDLSHWRDGPGLARQLSLIGVPPAFSWSLSDWTVGRASDPDGVASVVHETSRLNSTATRRALAESWYDAKGLIVGALYYELVCRGLSNGTDSSWTTQPHLVGSESFNPWTPGVDDNGPNGPVARTLFSSGPGRTMAILQTYYGGNFTGDAGGDAWHTYWRRLKVFGDYIAMGLTIRGTPPNHGFYASDIVRHAVTAFAPMLRLQPDSIQSSSWIIEQAAFLEATTAAEIIRQVTRFGLQDWAVWDDREFVWHDRGARGNRWVARVDSAQLEQAGPQVDRLWESIAVQYQDPDGTTRTVGPPGSGADVESSRLQVSDPDHPAVQLGLTRRDVLVMGKGSANSAIEVGTRFLEQAAVLNTAGRAQIVGHIQDERGVLHPAWAVRAGDTIEFVNARDTSPRRIVKTDYTHDTRTCTIDLDSPPEGLAALLERLDASLVPIGIS